jgi:phenylacetate 2-hydroxylase
VDYNEIKSALVAIPRDFKVKLIPRDEALAAEVLKMGEERTRDFYKE